MFEFTVEYYHILTFIGLILIITAVTGRMNIFGARIEGSNTKSQENKLLLIGIISIFMSIIIGAAYEHLGKDESIDIGNYAIVSVFDKGFLNMRSVPFEDDNVIVEIDHGSRIEIIECYNIDRENRYEWCLAKYRSYEGWVYDRYLIYE